MASVSLADAPRATGDPRRSTSTGRRGRSDSRRAAWPRSATSLFLGTGCSEGAGSDASPTSAASSWCLAAPPPTQPRPPGSAGRGRRLEGGWDSASGSQARGRVARNCFWSSSAASSRPEHGRRSTRRLGDLVGGQGQGGVRCRAARSTASAGDATPVRPTRGSEGGGEEHHAEDDADRPDGVVDLVVPDADEVDHDHGTERPVLADDRHGEQRGRAGRRRGAVRGARARPGGRLRRPAQRDLVIPS